MIGYELRCILDNDNCKECADTFNPNDCPVYEECRVPLEGAENTEQQDQPDNGHICKRPGSCAKGSGGKCYSGFDCPDKAVAG